MNGFYIRNREGYLKGSIEGEHAINFMKSVQGHWTSITTKNGERKNIYEIDMDCNYTTENRTARIRLFFFEGDYLVPM